MPDFDDGKGVSLVMRSTRKGGNLLNILKASGELRPVDISDYLQPNLQMPTPRPDDLENFWEEYHQSGFERVFKTYCLRGQTAEEFKYLEKTQYVKRFFRKAKSCYAKFTKAAN